MSTAHEVFNGLCQAYARATNASDLVAYGKLFAQDAIRMPPGADPEYGPAAIQKSDQGAYDLARWDVTITPRDALPIADDWVYGIGDVEATTVAHADGTTSRFRLTATWLLHRESSGKWLIKRQMWNRKPDQV